MHFESKVSMKRQMTASHNRDEGDNRLEINYGKIKVRYFATGSNNTSIE
jgi:hypothetical protein